MAEVQIATGKAKRVAVEECLCPSRVLVGNCPLCRGVVVVLNEYGVWPLVRCACGWVDSTEGLVNKVRFEREMPRQISEETHL